MFEPLIVGAIAIYMLLGWAFLLLLDRRRMAERRTPRAFALAVLFWPVTLIADLVARAREGPRS